jgi:hypothetical protein
MRTSLPLLAALLTVPFAAHAAEWTLTVRAGDRERAGSIVAFTAPKELRGAAVLKGAGGVELPVQIDDAGRAVFIEPQIAKGAVKTYTLTAAGKGPDFIAAKKDGDVLKFTAGGAPFFSYQMAPGPVPEGVSPIYSHGAYLHPVFGPGGKLVTGDFPPDHRHQRGIFFAWTHTEFEGHQPDFWNMGKGDAKADAKENPVGKLLAEVRFASLEKSWGGPVHGGFVGRHRFIDHAAEPAKDALHETWEMTAYRVNAGRTPVNVMDLISTQTCASASPVKLPKYHYGGLGVRGNALWDPVDKVTMFTSNGDDRAKGDATKAKWVHIGGDVDGAPTGMAVLIHPSNFRFPQPLRLNPKNPQLCVAPSQDGDWEIAPGKPYVSRYRIIVADGKADAALLESLWADYAEPATAEVK